MFTGPYGVSEDGTYSEWLAVRKQDLCLIPEGIDDTSAAGILPGLGHADDRDVKTFIVRQGQQRGKGLLVCKITSRAEENECIGCPPGFFTDPYCAKACSAS